MQPLFTIASVRFDNGVLGAPADGGDFVVIRRTLEAKFLLT